MSVCCWKCKHPQHDKHEGCGLLSLNATSRAREFDETECCRVHSRPSAHDEPITCQRRLVRSMSHAPLTRNPMSVCRALLCLNTSSKAKNLRRLENSLSPVTTPTALRLFGGKIPSQCQHDSCSHSWTRPPNRWTRGLVKTNIKINTRHPHACRTCEGK